MRLLPCVALLLFVTALSAADSTSLFNGKDFTGWKTKPTKKDATAESLEGKTEAYKGRFKIEEGALVIDAKVKGDAWIESATPIEGDATIRFEFNPGPTCNNDTMFRGIKFDLKKQDIKNLKDNEWNAFEIIVKGDKAEYKCNGESIKTLSTKETKSGFALRAEFGTIKVRKIEVARAP